jgi:hypothetical protein
MVSKKTAREITSHDCITKIQLVIAFDLNG